MGDSDGEEKLELYPLVNQEKIHVQFPLNQ